MSAARIPLVGALAVFLALLAVTPARAIEPEQREAVVISARVWEGSEYREIFVPSSKTDLTLMAGRASAITFVRTLEYYWPLSRQVYVDFERQRDVLEGELVVRRNGNEVAREPLQPYSIDYPEGAANGGGHLLWGEEAERLHSEYRESEKRFAREFAEAQRAHAAYERRLLESGAARRPGEAAEPVEAPPPMPEPSLRLVTAPARAFRVDLPAGDYEMALQRDGEVVPGTERKLRVISLDGNQALVADIVPAERWTRPLASNIREARIFARPGAEFYLTLAEASRFDEAGYLAVVNPQAQPVTGRSLWIRRKPSGVEHVNVSWNGTDADDLSRQALKVEQTRGSGFGYRVRAARDGETADLNAFTVDVPSDPSVTRGSISIGSSSQPPFEREVVVVHPRRAELAFAISMLPLFAYFAVFSWHRYAGRGFGHQRKTSARTNGRPTKSAGDPDA